MRINRREPRPRVQPYYGQLGERGVNLIFGIPVGLCLLFFVISYAIDGFLALPHEQPANGWLAEVRLEIFLSCVFFGGLWIAASSFGLPKAGLLEWLMLTVQAGVISGVALSLGFMEEKWGSPIFPWFLLIWFQLMYVVVGAMIASFLSRYDKPGSAEASRFGVPRWRLMSEFFLLPVVLPALIGGTALFIMFGWILGPFFVMAALLVWPVIAWLRWRERKNRRNGGRAR